LRRKGEGQGTGAEWKKKNEKGDKKRLKLDTSHAERSLVVWSRPIFCVVVPMVRRDRNAPMD
jgi:hypothetical protein